MKTFFALMAAASSLAFPSAVTKVVKSVPADVTALAAAESRVVTVLHNYKPTSSWEAQLLSAQATRGKDLRKVKPISLLVPAAHRRLIPPR